MAGLQQQIKDPLTFPNCNSCAAIGGTFMSARKNWLDYDLVTLVFLLIGITAVEILALMI